MFNVIPGPKTAHGPTAIVRDADGIAMTAWIVRGRVVDQPRRSLDPWQRANARIAAQKFLSRPKIAA